MTSAIGYNPWERADNYVIVGKGADNLPTPTWVSTEDDKTQVERIAMAWLVAGYATRVIDLKLDGAGTADQNPAIVFRYENLDSVKATGVTRYSLHVQPPYVPKGLTQDAFYQWLRDYSNSPPDWPLPEEPKITAQAIVPQEPPPLPPPTVGMTHIQAHYGSTPFCGRVGHTEPDWAPHTPLKRDVNYCPDCVRIKETVIQDHWRAIARSHVYSHGMDFSVPGHSLMPMKLWEDDPDPVPPPNYMRQPYGPFNPPFGHGPFPPMATDLPPGQGSPLDQKGPTE